MNRIKHLFQTKKNILSIYFTAGYPAIDDTVPILESLEASGVDLVEIGIPFSDPLADGSVIQASSLKALQNGMSLKRLFQQLKDIREKISIPIILMGYFNTIYKFGITPFLGACKEVGVDGCIIPDLPMKEYLEKYQTDFDAQGISNIFLITPQSSDERICAIDKHSTGFIYMVSSAAITGSQKEITNFQKAYFNRVNKLELNTPTLIGFGISDRQSFEHACEFSHGAIIGSAFIKELSNKGFSADNVSHFVNRIRP
jgi:tryptophan synthase alpha chain